MSAFPVQDVVQELQLQESLQAARNAAAAEAAEAADKRERAHTKVLPPCLGVKALSCVVATCQRLLTNAHLASNGIRTCRSSLLNAALSVCVLLLQDLQPVVSSQLLTALQGMATMLDDAVKDDADWKRLSLIPDLLKAWPETLNKARNIVGDFQAGPAADRCLLQALIWFQLSCFAFGMLHSYPWISTVAAAWYACSRQPVPQESRDQHRRV